jgi:hypothetical protein
LKKTAGPQPSALRTESRGPDSRSGVDMQPPSQPSLFQRSISVGRPEPREVVRSKVNHPEEAVKGRPASLEPSHARQRRRITLRALGNLDSLPFLEFVEDASSLLRVLFWGDLPVGEQPIDSRQSLLHGLL